MQKKKKTILDLLAEKKSKVIASTLTKRNKVDECGEAVAKASKEAKTKPDDQELQKALDVARENYQKAISDFEQASIKACQHIEISDSDMDLENKAWKALVPPKKERTYFHVVLDKPAYSKNTGKKLSKAYVQTFSPKAFYSFIKSHSTLGYTISIIWDADTYAKLYNL